MNGELIYVENGVLVQRRFDPWSPSRQHMRDVSIPRGASDADLSAHGAIRVQPTPMPVADAVTELDPVLVDGRWVQAWDARSYTAQEIADKIQRRVQQRLDDWARERRYDDIHSAALRISSPVARFAAEGAHAMRLMDETWAAVMQIESDVANGVRAMPSGYDEIESELPALDWSEVSV